MAFVSHWRPGMRSKMRRGYFLFATLSILVKVIKARSQQYEEVIVPNDRIPFKPVSENVQYPPSSVVIEFPNSGKQISGYRSGSENPPRFYFADPFDNGDDDTDVPSGDQPFDSGIESSAGSSEDQTFNSRIDSTGDSSEDFPTSSLREPRGRALNSVSESEANAKKTPRKPKTGITGMNGPVMQPPGSGGGLGQIIQWPLSDMGQASPWPSMGTAPGQGTQWPGMGSVHGQETQSFRTSVVHGQGSQWPSTVPVPALGMQWPGLGDVPGQGAQWPGLGATFGQGSQWSNMGQGSQWPSMGQGYQWPNMGPTLGSTLDQTTDLNKVLAGCLIPRRQNQLSSSWTPNIRNLPSLKTGYWTNYYDNLQRLKLGSTGTPLSEEGAEVLMACIEAGLRNVLGMEAPQNPFIFNPDLGNWNPYDQTAYPAGYTQFPVTPYVQQPYTTWPQYPMSPYLQQPQIVPPQTPMSPVQQPSIVPPQTPVSPVQKPTIVPPVQPPVQKPDTGSPKFPESEYVLKQSLDLIAQKQLVPTTTKPPDVDRWIPYDPRIRLIQGTGLLPLDVTYRSYKDLIQ